jgi:hypothetical protein
MSPLLDKHGSSSVSAGLPRRPVLDWSDNLKGAATMIDPDSAGTTGTLADEELSVEDLDAVSGGTRSANIGSPSTILCGPIVAPV